MADENEGKAPGNDPQAQPAPDSGQSDQPTLTQADVDKVVASAKRGAKSQGIKEVLETLGVDSLETLKASLAEAEAAKQAQMSDLEKAQAQADALKAERDEALQLAKASEAQAVEMLMNAAIITASQQFNDPADALQFIDRSNIERDEQGNFTGIEAAIKALAESKPYLLKSAQSTPKGTPTRTANGQSVRNSVPIADTTNRPIIRF